MQVFDKDKNHLGSCAVLANKLIGSKFTVALALEGKSCEDCGVKHTEFKDIIYDIYIFGASQLGLMVRSIEDAKHLPGFTEV